MSCPTTERMLRGIKLVAKVGVEPTSLSAVEFESTVSAIPPLGHVYKLVAPVGFEPTKTYGLNVVAVPICICHGATKLERRVGLEPTESCLEGRHDNHSVNDASKV